MQREEFKMEQDFVRYIPPEITFEILSRLPARSVMKFKRVCKPWLNLFATPEFVTSHHSKSLPVLAVFEMKKLNPYKLIEFVDEVDLGCDEDHWNIVWNFQLPFHKPLYSSANGLLFLFGGDYDDFNLVLCNPYTREYITVPPPLRSFSHPKCYNSKYGFGVSRISGQYKLVRITIANNPTSPPYGYDQCDCQVYTVGTGLWIRIPSGSPLTDDYSDSTSAFLSGNFHWLAYQGSSFLISCLDLETEIFSTFPYPPVALDDPHKYRNLSVLRDCLCVCESLWDEGSSTCDIDVWLLKEYGNEKSWKKEFIIRKAGMDGSLGNICPVKVFRDGSILMASKGRKILFYSSKTNTIRQVILFGDVESIFGCMAFYAPSLLSLKTSFVMERVTSYLSGDEMLYVDDHGRPTFLYNEL